MTRYTITTETGFELDTLEAETPKAALRTHLDAIGYADSTIEGDDNDSVFGVDTGRDSSIYPAQGEYTVILAD